MSNPQRSGLPIILAAAIVQGWALYGLHHAIQEQHWPATRPGWLLALYAVFVFTPLTVQLLAAHADRARLWLTSAALGAAFFYFGWFHGGSVVGRDVEHFARSGETFPAAFELTLLWLIVLPFIQCRLASGAWVPGYRELFAVTWRNKLTLAEAGLFTGLFWLLLFLWQTLFHMLGIDYFRELFERPIFVYPVTALVFGLALHLIGSLEHWTRVVLEQLLSVLKWLGIVAAVILTCFTIALVFKLPTLVFSGERAIGAQWLLWLIAVLVLLINAAFRDGSVEQPYPRAIGAALRFVIPLLVIVALTAAYALSVRTREYGLTVERFWGLVVAAFAILYATGYSWSAFASPGWLSGITRVNVIAAVLMILVIASALTPMLSPYRLSADSQFRIAARAQTERWKSGRVTPFQYLRFYAGAYGEARLRELADARGSHPAAVREQAAAALTEDYLTIWAPHFTDADIDASLSRLTIYPAGQSLSPQLRECLVLDLKSHRKFGSEPSAGVFVDLMGDGRQEFALLSRDNLARVYEQVDGHWRLVGDFYGGQGATDKSLASHLAAGEIGSAERPWRDLRIGPYTYQFSGR